MTTADRDETLQERADRWYEEDLAFEHRDGFLAGVCLGLIIGGVIIVGLVWALS